MYRKKYRIRRLLTNSILLSNNWVFEWNFFWKVRSYSDGITFVNVDFNLDLYKSDHKPSLELMFVLFNITIIELRIYWRWHRIEA